MENNKGSKKGRALVLRTHSIEEANTLSDRIGFVVKGRLCFIGTLIRLQACFSIGNIQRGLATLEEAFLNIAKKAEVEETIVVEEDGLELLE